jgi:vanillate O-demethylase monooxygenase subunit
MPFSRNAWYVAAWADEVKTNTLMARKILNEPILFYRDTSSNAAVA